MTEFEVLACLVSLPSSCESQTCTCSLYYPKRRPAIFHRSSHIQIAIVLHALPSSALLNPNRGLLRHKDQLTSQITCVFSWKTMQTRGKPTHNRRADTDCKPLIAIFKIWSKRRLANQIPWIMSHDQYRVRKRRPVTVERSASCS